jgi:hypothetical protein
MLKLLAYYTAATILLAFVDYWRRKKQMGKVVNIDHTVSAVLGLGCYCILWFYAVWVHIIFKPHSPWYIYVVEILVLGLGCVGVRTVVYDPIINILIDGKLSNISTTTDSYKDTHTYHVSFWGMRAIGAGLIIVSLFINYLLTK